MTTHSFTHRLRGTFDGLVRLADVAQLEEAIALREGWYLLKPGDWEPGEESPPVDGTAARDHLRELVAEILREERGEWTTMIYAQSALDPWIIKVFHPRRAGCGCGGQGGILPWWILSRIPPEPIPAWQVAPSCDLPTRKKWWRR